MSFGYSAGDFITALKIANDIRRRFVDAPTQYKAISKEIKSLSIVLQDVDDILPQRKLTQIQQNELETISAGCLDTLTDIKKELQKYDGVDSDQKQWRERAHKVWKRVRWDPRTIDEFRTRISTNVGLFNAFHGRLAVGVSLAIKDMVDELHHRDDCHRHQQAHQDFIAWLSPIEYVQKQCDLLSQRQDGTGQWLLESHQFQDWVEGKLPTLFCPGYPGVGKTMLTATAVEYLERKFAKDSSVGIAYIYCNFRQHGEQKPIHLLTSLLGQLVQQQPSLPDKVKSIYEYHAKRKSRPTLNEVTKMLRSLISSYSTVLILVDALDECHASGGSRREFLSHIFNIQSTTGACVFATSRINPEISSLFETATTLEIRASTSDMRKYAEAHMPQLPSVVQRNKDLQEEITTALITAADGMFLLVYLHLKSLVGKLSLKAIRTALKNLPQGSNAYDYAYEEAMERIEHQASGHSEFAKRVLSWITCAKRPLTTIELQHALAVEAGEPEMDTDNLVEIDDIVSVCAGLVVIDEESDIVRLVHYTTQEYFGRTCKHWFPNAELEVTRTCVTYISFNYFESGPCRNAQEFSLRLHSYPLYEYASQYWGHHVAAVTTGCHPSKNTTEMDELIQVFLENNAKIAGTFQALFPIVFGNHVRQPSGVTGIHIAAYFGLEKLATNLLKRDSHANSEDSMGNTPLSLAASEGHTEIVKLLLQKVSVDPDSNNDLSYTPLCFAVLMVI